MTAQQRDAAATGLARIVTGSRLRAPQARVILVDYLPMVGEPTVPFEDVPFDAASIEALASVHAQLSGVFADVAERTRVELVLASQLGRGHELGSPSPWIQPLQPIYRVAASFHPSTDGMNAVATELARTITRRAGRS